MRRREFVAAALAVPVAPALARDVARLVPAPRDAIRIASPNGSVEFELRHAVGPRLSYGVTFRNQRVIEPSPLGIVVDGVDLGQGVEAGTVETYYGNERYPWRGVHAEAINRFKGARIAVRHTASATDYLVEVRVFDDGIGFRCVVPSEGSRVPDEATAVVIPAHAAARGDDRPRSECTRELRHRAQPLAAAGAASLPQGASYRLDQARPSGLEVPGRRRRKHARDHERVLAARGRTGFRIQPGGRLLAALERERAAGAGRLLQAAQRRDLAVEAQPRHPGPGGPRSVLRTRSGRWRRGREAGLLRSRSQGDHGSVPGGARGSGGAPADGQLSRRQ